VATRIAKQRLFARRAQPEVKAAKAAIVDKHGSRKRSAPRSKKKPPSEVTQMALDL
jgi:deoxyribodipyrimidine photo-lyase